MRAHPNEQLRLLELAQIDAEHARLQHTATNMPEQLHLVEIEGERRSKRVAAATALGALEDAQVELRRIQDDARVVAERRELDETRLASATSTKDITALERELETIARRSNELDDRELAQLEEVERLQSERDARKAELDEIEALAADLTERREQARDHIRAEAKELHAKRQVLVAAIPPELLAVYTEAKAHGGIGAAELIGTVSGATNETLDPAELARIRNLAADELAFCPSTGAVLVRTARSALLGPNS